MLENRTKNMTKTVVALTLCSVVMIMGGGIAVAEDAASADGAKAVAEFNGKTFTKADLEKSLMGLNPRARRTLSEDPKRLTQFIENHIISDLIYTEGRRLDYGDDPEIRKQLEELERHLIVQKVMQEQQSAPIDDAVVRAYYDEHQDEFSSARVKASHILVQDKELADRLHAQIVEDPSTFEALAAEHSTDRSNSQRGGDLGFFGRGRMVSEFEETAFAMEEDGELSEPVQTRFGWHIIKRTAREDGTIKEYSEVENQIRVKLVSEMRRERTQEFLEKLKKDSGLVVHQEALTGLDLPASTKKEKGKDKDSDGKHHGQ